MEAGLYCHVWDLVDGVDEFLEWAASNGITQLNIAGTYHAGWFLHPHSSRHRAYMPEDGVCYFQPQDELYANTRIKPPVAKICRETDWLRVAAEKADDYGLKIISWTIGTHNTRLGSEYSELATRNCFGDVYPHALCPAHPEVAEYLKALAQDLTCSIPLHGLQLESFGYLGWRHGHHHERDLTELTAVEARLMNLCFHPATCERAEAEGVDVEPLRIGVRAILEDAMNYAPHRPDGHPKSWDEVCEQLPAITEYSDVCKNIENSLIHELKEVMRPDAELHPGGYNEALADIATAFSCSAYGQSPEQARESVSKARAKIPSRHKLNVGLRLGSGVPQSQEQLTQILAAVKEAGGDTAIFYNYSESPPTMLRWIKLAMEAISA